MICITIDGPSASGKSTVSDRLAKRFSFVHLDTGALYRAVAYFFLKNNLDYSNPKIVNNSLKNIIIDVKFIDNAQHVFLNGEDLNDKIRTNEVSNVASKTSSFAEVRNFLLDFQRSFSKTYNLIADGRDMGTVIFPNADLKFFLTASEKTRAKRRFEELLIKNPSISFEIVLDSMKKRDSDDSARKVAPLAPASDAIIFDNTSFTLDETFEYLSKIIERKVEPFKSHEK